MKTVMITFYHPGSKAEFNQEVSQGYVPPYPLFRNQSKHTRILNPPTKSFLSLRRSSLFLMGQKENVKVRERNV